MFVTDDQHLGKVVICGIFFKFAGSVGARQVGA